MPRAPRLALAPVTVFTVLVAAACSDTSARDRTEGAYCTEVGEHLGELNTTSFIDLDEAARVIEAWRTVAASAPVAVEPEWTSVLAAMETAFTVDPADAEALQAAADALRSAQPSADRVIEYTYRLCGALIGPVAPATTTPLQVPPTTATPDTTPDTTG